MDREVIIKKAQKHRKKKKRKKLAKILLFGLVIVLVILYFVLRFLNSGYFFMIDLDKNLYLKNGVIIYDDPNYKTFRSEINVESLDFFDDISVKWLPEDLDNYDGSHNGDNYLAYSFYIENTGEEEVGYWNEIIIDDVINGLDEVIRFRVYVDGVYTDYAKASIDGDAEEGTVSFLDDKNVFSNLVSDFKPGEKHKYTVVIWLEGSDLECTNNILGGELKAHMNFKSYIESENNN